MWSVVLARRCDTRPPRKPRSFPHDQRPHRGSTWGRTPLSPKIGTPLSTDTAVNTTRPTSRYGGVAPYGPG